MCYDMDEPRNMLSERSQSHKFTYCMIPFTWKSIELKSTEKGSRSEIAGDGGGEEECDMIAEEHVSFRGDKSF